jgi:putative tryptophan/tyrosine transport system substrate-binding protein
MRRRDLVILVGFGVAWPFAAFAQEPGRIYRLGSLFRAPRSDPNLIAFFEGMRQYGFVEGQNLLDDPNGYELRIEQFAGHASEIVKQRVDLILCAGDDAIRAAQQATKIFRSSLPRMTWSDQDSCIPWPSPKATQPATASCRLK